jgi:hypothetical protein
MSAPVSCVAREREQVGTVPEESLTPAAVCARIACLDHEVTAARERLPVAAARSQRWARGSLSEARRSPRTGAFRDRTPSRAELTSSSRGPPTSGPSGWTRWRSFAGDVGFDLGEIRLSRPRRVERAVGRTPETAAGDAFELVKIDDLGGHRESFVIVLDRSRRARSLRPGPLPRCSPVGRREWPRSTRGGEL